MDEEAFLTTIALDPSKNAPRLVYADWLEEQNRPLEASFVRIECELFNHDREERLRERDKVDLPDETILDLFGQRCLLLAKVSTAKRNLPENWIKTLCRLYEDQLYAREREIQTYSTKKVTLTEMIA
jgi:uncharacterized protein (TIGR02996 family)